MALMIDTIEALPGADSALEAPSIMVPRRHRIDFEETLRDLVREGCTVKATVDHKFFSSLWTDFEISGPTASVRKFVTYLLEVAA